MWRLMVNQRYSILADRDEGECNRFSVVTSHLEIPRILQAIILDISIVEDLRESYRWLSRLISLVIG